MIFEAQPVQRHPETDREIKSFSYAETDIRNNAMRGQDQTQGKQYGRRIPAPVRETRG